MLRLAVLASLAVVLASACRLSLEDGEAPTQIDASLIDSSIDAPLAPSCVASTTHSDLEFIEDVIFRQSCVFSGCHDGANNAAGQIDLRPPGAGMPPAPGLPGRSAAFLVNVDSVLDPAHKLVVPNQPNQSYLLMMLQHIPPADMNPPSSAPDPTIGYMPQNAGGNPLCVEKRDAIQRWIEAGALAN